MTLHPITPIRMNPKEKADLVKLSKRLKMNQSSTVRALVREALSILNEQDEQRTARPRGRHNTKTAMAQNWDKVT